MHLWQWSIALQTVPGDPQETVDWWSQIIMPGENAEVSGAQLIILLVALIVIALLCRMLYSVLLYNWGSTNRHPANLRRALYALAGLLAIACFEVVFWNILGVLMLIILFAFWLICVLILIFTKRKVAAAQ